MCCGSNFLTVRCAGGAADDSFHERTAEIVGAGAQTTLRPQGPELRPGSLYVRYRGAEDEARHGVHENSFAQGRTFARLAAQIQRASICTYGSGNELGESASVSLTRTQSQ